MPIKVIAFDALGTAFDASKLPRDEIRSYLAQATSRPWAPLELPDAWGDLIAFPDMSKGIDRLRKSFIGVTTCSNLPGPLLSKLSMRNEVFWDINPLEKLKVYKPDPAAYLSVCQAYGVEPCDVLMVTANPTFGPFKFGDIEMARMLGMQAQLIRQPGCPQTIIELADQLCDKRTK